MRILREASREERAEFEKLKHNRLIVEYLQQAKSISTEHLIRVPDDSDFRTVQGYAQVLTHILTLIDPESAKP